MKSSDGVDCENIGAATGRGALGSVTVLSWADETDPSQLDRGFVAVSGLLAQRGRTLRQREFTTLAQLTALPDGIELVRYSGLDQLRETLRARFGGRHKPPGWACRQMRSAATPGQRRCTPSGIGATS